LNNSKKKKKLETCPYIYFNNSYIVQALAAKSTEDFYGLAM